MKLTPEETNDIKLNEGQKITFMYVGGALSTIKVEAKITGVHDGRPLYKEKGQRKAFYLPLNTETMIFDGWNIPLHTEMDKSDGFFMDAQMNLWGDAGEIKEYIEANNLNPHFSQYSKAQIIAVTASDEEHNHRVEVYPTTA